MNVTAEDLRQFIERYEQLESEKQDIAEHQKEMMADAKSGGFDTKALRRVIQLRKMRPDGCDRHSNAQRGDEPACKQYEPKDEN